MKIKNFKMLLLIAAVLFSVNGLLFAQSTMTVVDLPATGTDAAIGIDAAKTYTHAIDFGLGNIATINGVEFFLVEDNFKSVDAVKEYTSDQGYGFIVDDSRNPAVNIEANDGASSDASSQCDGGSVDLLTDMIYHSRAQEIGESILITLKDLTPGTKYSVRYYYRSWDAPPITPRPLTIMADGASNGVFADSIQIDIDTGGAHYLDYTFVSNDSDVTIKFAFHDDNQGAHIYGLTCEILEGTGIDSKVSAKPSTFGLMQNYPNPFNPSTTIEYTLGKNTKTEIVVYDLLGNKVATLVNSYQNMGTHKVAWDASGVSAGVYVYQIKTEDFIQSKKMILVK